VLQFAQVKMKYSAQDHVFVFKISIESMVYVANVLLVQFIVRLHNLVPMFAQVLMKFIVQDHAFALKTTIELTELVVNAHRTLCTIQLPKVASA
jgi:hypothetical protein